MFKIVAMSILVLAVAPMGNSMASEPTDAPQAANTPQAQEAVRRARQLVAEQSKAGEDAIEVKHVEPKTWNDSSMGCGKPGTMALQVITDGYVVSLMAQGREYRVHVSGNNALVCDKPVLMRSDPRRATNARGLDVAITQARADLVQRLGIDAAKVRVLGTEPHRWPDTGMDCPLPDQPVQPGPVDGYKIQVQHAGRIYIYHTDLNVVRACPAIEAQ
ncbi:MAG TPA: hypothetical protein VGN07_11955 [Steroidobacteraceae bacterium]|jgi:hypothetical protein